MGIFMIWISAISALSGCLSVLLNSFIRKSWAFPFHSLTIRPTAAPLTLLLRSPVMLRRQSLEQSFGKICLQDRGKQNCANCITVSKQQLNAANEVAFNWHKAKLDNEATSCSTLPSIIKFRQKLGYVFIVLRVRTVHTRSTVLTKFRFDQIAMSQVKSYFRMSHDTLL